MDTTTLAAACESTQRFVEAVTDEQLALPTPCSEWNVRDLLGHIVGTLELGRALLTDSTPSVAVEPGGLPGGDLLGDDPVKAYRAGVEALLAVATDDAVASVHITPFGEMHGAMILGFTTVDITQHGWDLAVATGQDPALEGALATSVLAFARQTLSDETRAPRIGPEVAVTSSAPTDQLAGFMGRTP